MATNSLRPRPRLKPLATRAQDTDFRLSIATFCAQGAANRQRIQTRRWFVKYKLPRRCSRSCLRGRRPMFGAEPRWEAGPPEWRSPYQRSQPRRPRRVDPVLSSLMRSCEQPSIAQDAHELRPPCRAVGFEVARAPDDESDGKGAAVAHADVELIEADPLGPLLGAAAAVDERLAAVVRRHVCLAPGYAPRARVEPLS